MRRLFRCIGLFLFATLQSPAQDIAVASPDGKISAVIARAADGALTWSIQKGLAPILLPSRAGITVDGEDLGQGVVLANPTLQVSREIYPMSGGHATASNEYREAKIPINSGSKKTAWTLEVRVYNDGAAYRYRVPGNNEERTIQGESTSWVFPPAGRIWFQDSGSPNYENGFEVAELSSFPQNRTLMSDCTIKLASGLGYAMPTEANTVDYSDMVLKPAGENQLKAFFPNDAGGWKQRGDILSPWRVTIYSPDLNGLVNTDILRNLCPAPSPKLAQARWILPGRASWHWMVTGKPKLEDQKKWVDWTRKLGFEYYLIDDGWNEWGSIEQDPWEAMKTVVDYAKTQNVKIWAWVHTKEITEPTARIAYFEKAKAIGLVGLKIDFMGAPSAHWMHWYDETLRAAAQAELMIDFHGCVKPSGRERTWPHELTREGIKGRENEKQPGFALTTLPFTRYVQGHADFTPTDWRGDKLRGASYANELAQAIVFTTSLLCYGGAPENYLANAGIEMLKAIPAAWDETIVLPGSEIGAVAAYARRKGNEWFIGIINGEAARKMDISLSFLGGGTWQSEQWGDAPEKNDAWVRRKVAVTSRDQLHLEMRAEGGFVARLTR